MTSKIPTKLTPAILDIATKLTGFDMKNRRYLGCKNKLLGFIETSIRESKIEFDTFFDGFAGTGVVGQHFADQGVRVISNDILISNYMALHAFSGAENLRTEKLDKIVRSWDNLSLLPGYFTGIYAEKYFSYDVCAAIDAVRSDIDEQRIKNRLNKREVHYLITSLLFAVDRAANTVGHYDAFRRTAPTTGNLEFRSLAVRSHIGCRQFNDDIMNVAENIVADVTYLDPPYNSRQYSSCYHVLENIAVGGSLTTSGLANKPDLTNKKSKWCTKEALSELKLLLEKLQTKHIVVSYNNMFEKGDGRSAVRISMNELNAALSRHGKVRLYETPYSAFNTGKTSISDHKELLFICSK